MSLSSQSGVFASIGVLIFDLTLISMRFQPILKIPFFRSGPFTLIYSDLLLVIEWARYIPYVLSPFVVQNAGKWAELAIWTWPNFFALLSQAILLVASVSSAPSPSSSKLFANVSLPPPLSSSSSLAQGGPCGLPRHSSLSGGLSSAGSS